MNRYFVIYKHTENGKSFEKIPVTFNGVKYRIISENKELIGIHVTYVGNLDALVGLIAFGFIEVTAGDFNKLKKLNKNEPYIPDEPVKGSTAFENLTNFMRSLPGPHSGFDQTVIKWDLETYSTFIDNVLPELKAELLKAKAKHPEQLNSAHEGYAIIKEEFDELWDEIKKKEELHDPLAQREEALQTAAMLLRFIIEIL